ncbi:TTC1 [Scenedesmus sp. PABB004]|nr:TTC1 [Scenedesmus sp. PABB004]
MVGAAAPGAAGLREQGNALFKAGDFLKAAAKYTAALREPGTPDADAARLYSNRSAALLKLNKVAKALADAEAAVRLDPGWDKAHMRMALALESAERLEEALAAYQRAAAAAAAGADAEYAARVKALTKAVGRRASTAAKVAKSKARHSPAEAAALEWAEAKCAYALERARDEGTGFAPELHFLQGRGTSGGGAAAASGEVAVRAARAFDAPEVLAEFVGQMRSKAEELGARAVLLIAPKQAVAFPQTWRRADWPFAAHDGVFVQLQATVAAAPADSAGGRPDQAAKGAGEGSSVLRRVWFIRMRDGKPPLEAQEVGQEFELLPLVLK